MLHFKRQFRFPSRTAVEGLRNAGQVVGSFLKVTVVHVILFGEYRLHSESAEGDTMAETQLTEGIVNIRLGEDLPSRWHSVVEEELST